MGCLVADGCSKAPGGKWPSLACSRTLLQKATMQPAMPVMASAWLAQSRCQTRSAVAYPGLVGAARVEAPRQHIGRDRQRVATVRGVYKLALPQRT